MVRPHRSCRRHVCTATCTAAATRGSHHNTVRARLHGQTVFDEPGVRGRARCSCAHEQHEGSGLRGRGEHLHSGGRRGERACHGAGSCASEHRRRRPCGADTPARRGFEHHRRPCSAATASSALRTAPAGEEHAARAVRRSAQPAATAPTANARAATRARHAAAPTGSPPSFDAKASRSRSRGIGAPGTPSCMTGASVCDSLPFCGGWQPSSGR